MCICPAGCFPPAPPSSPRDRSEGSCLKTWEPRAAGGTCTVPGHRTLVWQRWALYPALSRPLSFPRWEPRSVAALLPESPVGPGAQAGESLQPTGCSASLGVSRGGCSERGSGKRTGELAHRGREAALLSTPPGEGLRVTHRGLESRCCCSSDLGQVSLPLSLSLLTQKWVKPLLCQCWEAQGATAPQAPEQGLALRCPQEQPL